MAIELQLRGFEDTIKNLETMPRAIDDVMRTFVKRASRLLLREVKSELSNKSVNKRSGKFRASVRDFVDGDGLTGGVGTKWKGARLREYGTAGLPGGVLRPKRAKYLAVPLPAVLTAAGVPRGNPRDFTDAFFIESKTGPLILMGKPTGSSRKPLPLFVMKKSVEQKEQRPFRNAEETMRPVLQQGAIDAIKKMLE